MKNITPLGVDLAKNVFQLYGVNAKGEKVFSKRVSRKELLSTIVQLPNCLIGLEACSGAHHWARKFEEMGHTVKIMSPQYVKPYVKTNKNDYNDAEAISEAVTRPNMHFVPIKSVAQQDLLLNHRVRKRLVGKKTQLENHIRGLLAEYGFVIPKGSHHLRKHLVAITSDTENALSSMSRPIFEDLYQELLAVSAKVKSYTEKLEAIADQDEQCQRIRAIEGIGPMNATALVASIQDPTLFKKGRQVSAWLGLVPRQNSSGDKQRLGGISKRGDRYLRALLIHGARSVVRHAMKKTDHRSLWIQQLVVRRGVNRATVAVANKNARLVWALLHSGKTYQPRKAAA